jgi:hypothetical protein
MTTNNATQQNDVHAIREFVLIMENDGALYTQRISPIIANLQRKVNKGVYDAVKAVKLVQYAVDDYERANAIEIVGRRLTKSERHAVAIEIFEYIDELLKEGTDGNFKAYFSDNDGNRYTHTFDNERDAYDYAKAHGLNVIMIEGNN